EFRMVYGQDLDRLGEDAVPEAWRRYVLFGLVRLLVDIAVRLPGEYLAEIRQDVIFALRVLARSPGFAAVAILSLAIGIGMCSVILGGSNAMHGPLPGARDPAALLTPRRQISYPYFEHYRDQKQVPVTATAFLTSVPFAVAPGGDPGFDPANLTLFSIRPRRFQRHRPSGERPASARRRSVPAGLD